MILARSASEAYHDGRIDLPAALASAKAIFGPSFNPQITLNPETAVIARRIVWFERPDEALEDPVRFMAYAMRYATHEDMNALRRYVSDDDFRETLEKAPPGIIDPHSWSYWNYIMGRYPAPSMPKRRCEIALESSAMAGDDVTPDMLSSGFECHSVTSSLKSSPI